MTPLFEESQRLLRLALRDQETFALLLPLPGASIAALGFLAQQAVEKALKSVVVLRGVEVRRTHDLAALALRLQESGIGLPIAVDELRRLNPFAVEYRYDDEIVPAMAQEEIVAVLAAVMPWASEQIAVAKARLGAE